MKITKVFTLRWGCSVGLHLVTPASVSRSVHHGIRHPIRNGLAGSVWHLRLWVIPPCRISATPSTTAAATSGPGIRSPVDTDGPSIESNLCPLLETGSKWQKSSSYSMLFMPAMAFWASASLTYRTNPNPRLRPVSRSFTTT